MKRVGVREFRDHATQYLAGDDVLTIERHGQPIGVYIPTAGNRRKRLKERLDSLEKTVQRILADTSLTEDEFADLFDFNRPVPEQPKPRPEPVNAGDHAARH